MKFIGEHQFVDESDKIAFDHVDSDSFENMLAGKLVFSQDYFIVSTKIGTPTFDTPQTFGEIGNVNHDWLVYVNRHHGFTMHEGSNIYTGTFSSQQTRISHDHGPIPSEYNLKNDSKVVFADMEASSIDGLLDRIHPGRKKVIGYFVSLPYEIGTP